MNIDVELSYPQKFYIFRERLSNVEGWPKKHIRIKLFKQKQKGNGMVYKEILTYGYPR